MNRPKPTDVGLLYVSMVTRDGLTALTHNSLRDHVSFSCGLYHMSYIVLGGLRGRCAIECLGSCLYVHVGQTESF